MMKLSGECGGFCGPHLSEHLMTQGMPPKSHRIEMKSFNDESTVESQLVVINSSTGPLQLVWLGFEVGQEQVYNVVLPESQLVQPTYSTHAWALKDSEGQTLLRYLGPSASLTITCDQGTEVKVLKSQ